MDQNAGECHLLLPLGPTFQSETFTYIRPAQLRKLEGPNWSTQICRGSQSKSLFRCSLEETLKRQLTIRSRIFATSTAIEKALTGCMLHAGRMLCRPDQYVSKINLHQSHYDATILLTLRTSLIVYCFSSEVIMREQKKSGKSSRISSRWTVPIVKWSVWGRAWTQLSGACTTLESFLRVSLKSILKRLFGEKCDK